LTLGIDKRTLPHRVASTRPPIRQKRGLVAMTPIPRSPAPLHVRTATRPWQGWHRWRPAGDRLLAWFALVAAVVVFADFAATF